MARKSERELVSFRLNPDLAAFLRNQARLQSISLTELVNRLLYWAVQDLSNALSQGVSIAPVPQQQSLSSVSEVRAVPVAYPQTAALTPVYQFSGRGIAPLPPNQGGAPTVQFTPTEPPDKSQLSSNELEKLRHDIQRLDERLREYEQSSQEYHEKDRELLKNR